MAVAAADHGTVEVDQDPGGPATVVISTVIDNETVSTAVTPEAAAELELAIEQARGQPATVTVSANGSAVENASVGVETVDDNAAYAGANESYATDENGTVELHPPGEIVEMNVTAAYRGAEEAVTTTLDSIEAIDGELSFGQQLQRFKIALNPGAQAGPEIASWVTENDPGNAPDHAGPKDTAMGEDDRGPTAHAGVDEDGDESADENNDDAKDADEEDDGVDDDSDGSETDTESDDDGTGCDEDSSSNDDGDDSDVGSGSDRSGDESSGSSSNNGNSGNNGNGNNGNGNSNR